MNNEIKEILDKMQNFIQEPIEIKMYGISLLNYEVKHLLDYITNLQQELKIMVKDDERSQETIIRLTKENERLKARLTDTEWQYDNARIKVEKQYIKGITEEVIEDIEHCFFNGEEKPDLIPIDSLDVCHIFGYIDYLKEKRKYDLCFIEHLKKDKQDLQQFNQKNIDRFCDYKSRCEKASDKIQYIIDYGFDYDGFNTVESLKGLIDMLVDYARESKNILQNGSDENE